MKKIWIDAVEFESYGGWKLETQFVREMGSSYLIANDIPGVPVKNASTHFEVNEEGYYRIFVRTKNWKLPEAPGQFKIEINGKKLGNVCGKMPSPSWYWEIAGDIELKKGTHSISLADETGWLSRFSAIVITNDFNFVPSPEIKRMYKQRGEIKGLDIDKTTSHDFDFVVVGAGPGGVPAAISAARNGLKTALICGRPFVGGNASNEGTIGLDGGASKGTGMHETGIVNEIKRVREHKKVTWQGSMEYLLSKEENLTLFENTLCIDAICENNTIKSAVCVNTITLEKSIVNGKYFADCSGDGWLGYYAGAAYRLGREAKHEYNEEFAPETPDTNTMSGCICGSDSAVPQYRSFYAVDKGEPVEFKLPDWAIHFPENIYRTPTEVSTAPWWIENSNDYDDLWEAENARDEMVRIAVGYFGWLKTHFENGEKAKNMQLIKIALHNSKRESRRLIGDYVMSQSDYTESANFEDAVSYTGWALDTHHIKGIYSGKEGPFLSNKSIPITPVPYRCLYSVNINNLFIASRCGSYTHIGLGSARVEATLASFGQVVGTAASLCNKYNCTPRDIYKTHIKELKQQLLFDDHTVLGEVNEDIRDKARNATITASSFLPSEDGVSNHPENVINGKLRSDTNSNNAWVSDEQYGLPASITLTFKNVEEISMVQVTADTDLKYPRYAYQPVPEYNLTASDFSVEIKTNGVWKTVGTVKDNFIRQNRVYFDKTPAIAVKITVTKTLGCNFAKINEIRIY